MRREKILNNVRFVLARNLAKKEKTMAPLNAFFTEQAIKEGEQKLKPCPLCNGYAQLRHGKKYSVTTQSYHDDTEYRLPASVSCKDCNLSVSWSVDISEYKHINDAFMDVAKTVSEKWNTRPGEQFAVTPCDDVKELARQVHEECFVDVAQGYNPHLVWDIDIATSLISSFVQSRERAAVIEKLEFLHKSIVKDFPDHDRFLCGRDHENTIICGEIEKMLSELKGGE